MDNIIRIGVLGCAAIAKRSVIPALLALSDKFKLVAIASRDKNKALEFGKLFNIEAIEGYENLLLRNDIDAVYMPLPTGLHKEWIIKAIRLGKHVYVEKAFARSNSDAVNIVNFARKEKCAVMEGFMFQYHSQHQKVFELLSNGTIGEIRSFSASFGFPPLQQDNFRYDNEIGGGALMDTAGYVVRAAFFILNTELQVNGASIFYNPDIGTSIWGNVFMKGSEGVGALLSFGFDNFYQCNYQILGSKGKITLTKAFTPRPDEKPVMILETTHEHFKECVLEADNHFIKAFIEFNNIIINEQMRQKHYSDILLQSKALDDIVSFSRRPG